jgi:hypothetical protein
LNSKIGIKHCLTSTTSVECRASDGIAIGVLDTLIDHATGKEGTSLAQRRIDGGKMFKDLLRHA